MQEFEQRAYVTEIDPKTGRNVTHRVKKILFRYTSEEKLQIVREYLTSAVSLDMVMDKYHIGCRETFIMGQALSPFYQENGRAKHMDEFGSMLRTFNCHYEFEKHTDEWEKPYSYQARVFVSRYY